MDLPTEILCEIASHLTAGELGSFRLINRMFSLAGAPLIARNGISILNTPSSLDNIQKLLERNSSIARTTQKLSIEYGEWPVCTRDEWDSHYLLFGRTTIRDLGQQATNSAEADAAFAEYMVFIAEEQGRTLHKDVEAFLRVLALLPELRTMTISHMQIWSWHPSRNFKYRKLQQKIWMTPYINDTIEPAVQIFLLALSNRFSNINCLTIYGTLKSAGLYPHLSGLQFPYIHKLVISSLDIRDNQDAAKWFLRAFPKLVDLSIVFSHRDSSFGDVLESFVGDLFWPHLKMLHLDELWASEAEIFRIFIHHQDTLKIFSLGNVTLTKGSWRSLFTQIRSLRAQVRIIADGAFNSKVTEDTLNMFGTGAIDLAGFLADCSASWPFGN
jgi:hypothetical protein